MVIKREDPGRFTKDNSTKSYQFSSPENQSTSLFISTFKLQIRNFLDTTKLFLKFKCSLLLIDHYQYCKYHIGNQFGTRFPKNVGIKKIGIFFEINHKFGSKRLSYNQCIMNFLGSFYSKIPKLVQTIVKIRFFANFHNLVFTNAKTWHFLGCQISLFNSRFMV